jgi:hypothetical protein
VVAQQQLARLQGPLVLVLQQALQLLALLLLHLRKSWAARSWLGRC